MLGRETIMAQRPSRRDVLHTLALAAGAPVALWATTRSLRAQGRCMLTAGAPACSTADIAPVFAPTGWKTTALEHITFGVVDYRAEASFYAALMGWTERSDAGTRAVMDAGDCGCVIFKQADASPAAGGRGGAARAIVESFGFVITPWDARAVEAELRKRNLSPVADNGAGGFESFHVKDPDGFDLQICNARGLSSARRTSVPPTAPAPFTTTGWKTVWLDHISFSVTNYKETASFYTNLLGWKTTYDEGSQNELLMGDVGDMIVRGGNPLDPAFGRTGRGGNAGTRSARVDHISFGITPWDTDGVKAELEKRGLRAQIDTSSKHQAPDGSWVNDDIHTAAFKSYHTQTPNGYNLQISYVTKDNRLALSNAVRPR